MFRSIIRHRGQNYVILIKDDAIARINQRNFPTPFLAAASKFTRWPRLADLFNEMCRDPDHVAEKVRIHARDGGGTYSFEFHCDSPIGWAGTDARDKYPDEALEPYAPNGRSTVLRVKLDRTDLLAPLTNILTIVCEIRPKRHETLVIVRTLYPGPDAGPLSGDITASHGIIMFDFNHPGEQFPGENR